VVEDVVRQTLARLDLSAAIAELLRESVARLASTWSKQSTEATATTTLRLRQVQARLDRLTDAYVEQSLEREDYARRRESLLLELREVETKQRELSGPSRSVPEIVGEFLELAGRLYLTYKTAHPDQKRDLIRMCTSNRVMECKTLMMTLVSPFAELATGLQEACCSP